MEDNGDEQQQQQQSRREIHVLPFDLGSSHKKGKPLPGNRCNNADDDDNITLQLPECKASPAQQQHSVSTRFWSLQSLLTFNIKNVSFYQLPTTLLPTASIIPKFGHTIAYLENEQGGRHLSPATLEDYRLVGDPIVDTLLEALDTCGQPLKAGDDIFSLTDHKTLPDDVHSDLKSFFDYYHQTPSWYDSAQIQRGQRVFLKYTPAITISLYYRSLVAGFSIPKISKVIQSTAYLAPPSTPSDVTIRLMDTGALLGACFVEDMEVGGAGWKAVLRVRILHAKIRRSLLKRSGKRVWDTATYGIPINQEDLGATLLAFSINALFGVEYLAGISISNQEMKDYIAVWRYIGWLLGVLCEGDTMHALRPLDPCGSGWIPSNPDSITHAKSTLESIILHLLKPDESSVLIAHHLLNIGRPQREMKGEMRIGNENTKSQSLASTIKSQNNEPKQSFFFFFRALVCRQFIGHSLADALKLPLHPTWTKRTLLAILCFVYLSGFRVYTWTTMIFSEHFIAFHQRLLKGVHNEWSRLHPGRMARNLNTSSACPFAMVKQPIKE